MAREALSIRRRIKELGIPGTEPARPAVLVEDVVDADPGERRVCHVIDAAKVGVRR